MNSDIVFQINVIAVSIAIVAFILLAFTIVLILMLLSFNKYHTKIDQITDKLDGIIDNISDISSVVSEEADRIKDSLVNVHEIIDDVGGMSKNFTKSIKNFGGPKDILNVVIYAIISIFKKNKSNI